MRNFAVPVFRVRRSAWPFEGGKYVSEEDTEYHIQIVDYDGKVHHTVPVIGFTWIEASKIAWKIDDDEDVVRNHHTTRVVRKK